MPTPPSRKIRNAYEQEQFTAVWWIAHGANLMGADLKEDDVATGWLMYGYLLKGAVMDKIMQAVDRAFLKSEHIELGLDQLLLDEVQ